MDNRVSARFFHLIEKDAGGGNFEAILQSLSEQDFADREANIGGENAEPVIVRLERYAVEGDFCFGEIIRKQTNNKPPEVSNEGLAALTLSDGAGLGHSVSFRYHRPTNTLSLQNNPSGVSASRLRAYLKMKAPNSEILFDQVPTQNAIERFNNGSSRALEVELASPLNLPAIEGEDSSADKTVVEAARRLADAFEGLTVTVKISVGRSKGSLGKSPIESVINRLIPWQRSGQADVRKLKVTSKELSGDGDTEIINFLEEFLQERTTLDLPDADPLSNYNIRRDQLSIWHTVHRPYLEGLYAKQS